MRDKHEKNMDLYFIALVPHRELREEMRKIKERMKAEHGAGHALKSPAHITLQMPFKRSSEDEPIISEALRRFVTGEKSFTVDLDGFGAFAPRVIFIKISEPEPVRALHSRLKEVLMTELHFSPAEIMKDVQPHITVATRDLTKEAFSEAWPELQKEEFKASFDVHSAFLLKHNGRNWDILEEFPFGNNG
jgi:2'-5' RNA ligase